MRVCQTNHKPVAYAEAVCPVCTCSKNYLEALDKAETRIAQLEDELAVRMAEIITLRDLGYGGDSQ